MILRSIADGLSQRKWGTVATEVLIVVVGIFIGLQVDDWNQARIDRADINTYMQRIQRDLATDREFFTYLSGEAARKKIALATLKQLIENEPPANTNADEFFDSLQFSSTIGFEFPEVQTVTFLDLQSSGKLSLIEDAELRRKLQFYHQESLHRSYRIESRITGYAATLYSMVDARIQLVSRDPELYIDTSNDDKGNFDLDTAREDFLAAARINGLSRLIMAEQNYTEFLIAQLKLQMTATKELQQTVSDTLGKAGS